LVGEGAQDADEQGDVIPVHLQVPPDCNGWRLDHFLRSRVRRLSRTRIQQIIEQQVRFEDGRRARPASRVRASETIVLTKPAPVEPDVPRHLEILAEDAAFYALDKPAGLPIHATAKFWKNTVTWLLRERWPEQHLDVCHRIDRETSGVLLVARGREAASRLKTAFARRLIKKRYLALVHGVPRNAEGVIDRPMKLTDSPTKIVMGITADGLPSITRYRVLRRFARHALLACEPETGRQHQIRLHLAHVGHPIVGDKIYRASEAHFMRYCEEGLTPELLLAFDGLGRHALHAERLSFPHPVSGDLVTVASPLPADLTAYMTGLAPEESIAP
jgi:23S rRNA pseudouridine1911/1915/1917 synthase